MHETTQAMHATMQPLLRLTEANMALMTQFSTSSDVMKQSNANVQELIQQVQKTVTALVQSNAFAQLSQGMWKNYTEFLTEFSQSSMAALTEGQAELTRQAQETGDSVIKTIASRSKLSG